MSEFDAILAKAADGVTDLALFDYDWLFTLTKLDYLEGQDEIYEYVKAKINEDQDYYERLMRTGSARIAVCSADDTKWCTGISIEDKDAVDMSKWTGHNQLGKCLERIRALLRHREIITELNRLDFGNRAPRATN